MAPLDGVCTRPGYMDMASLSRMFVYDQHTTKPSFLFECLSTVSCPTWYSLGMYLDAWYLLVSRQAESRNSSSVEHEESLHEFFKEIEALGRRHFGSETIIIANHICMIVL